MRVTVCVVVSDFPRAEPDRIGQLVNVREPAGGANSLEILAERGGHRPPPRDAHTSRSLIKTPGKTPFAPTAAA